MKKLLFALGLSFLCYSASAETTKTVYSPFTNKLDFITKVTSATLGADAGLAANQCVQTDANGALSTSGSTCGSGGGAGSSGLETLFGTARSSPTATLAGNQSQFTGAVSGSTMTFSLNSTSVTLQGQNVIFLTTSFQSGATFYVSSGTIATQFNLLYSTPTLNGNGTYNWPLLISSNTLVRGIPNISYFQGNGNALVLNGKPDITIYDDLFDVDAFTNGGADFFGSQIRMTCTGNVTSCFPWGGRFNATTDNASQTGTGVGGYCFGPGTCRGLYGEGGTGAGKNYAGYFQAIQSTALNVAGYFNATGATRNYGILVDGGQVQVNSSMTVTGAGGVGVTYNLNVGSMTGAGLSTCGDSTHALAWTSGTNAFSCQSVTGSGGSGGYAVEPATVTFNLAVGVKGSTMALTNAIAANTLTISSSTTGINLVSVSSAVAVNPADYILTIASPTVPAPILFGIQLSGHVVSSGTAPSPGTCGTSPSVDGTDFQGVITVGGGVVTACTLTFSSVFSRTPVCVASDNSTTVSVSLGTITTSGVTFNTSATLGGGLIYYLCIGNKG